MAGGSVIGALRVVLGADTAALEKGLKDAQGTLASFGANVGKAGAAIGAAMVGVSAAIGIAVKGALDEADKLGKMAQSVGLPVEELSKLKYAADLSDVSLESLGKSLEKLSRAMVEVAGGGVGPAKEAFTALGIAVSNADGSLKSSQTVLEEVAAKFANYRDGAAKTALAMAIFGKAGADMIPLLNMGKDGLREAAAEAEELGIVLNGKTSAAAENFNDNLTRLGKVKDGIINQITEHLAPALSVLSDRFVQVAKDGGFVKEASTAILNVMNVLAREIAELSIRVSGIGAEFNALWKVMSAGSWEGMKQGWAEFNAAGLETEKRVQTMRQAFVNFATDVAGLTVWENEIAKIREVNKMIDALDKSRLKLDAPVMTKADDSGQKAIDKFIESTQKRIAVMDADSQTVGKNIGEQERLKITLQAQAIAIENNILPTAALAERLGALGTDAANAALKLQGMNLISKSFPMWQQYQIEVANTDAALRAAGASADQMAAAQDKLAAKYGMTWQTASASVVGSLSEMGGAMQGMGSQYAKVVKGIQVIAAGQALVSTLAGAADALKFGFPQNLAFSAAVLAKGMALVASIKAVSVPGFKAGGNFTIPGGVGGGDRVPVQFMAEPGEHVQVTPNGAANGGWNAPREIVVKVEGETFGRATIRKMIEGINEAIGDGYRLRTDPY
jgi:hypothetical protein